MGRPPKPPEEIGVQKSIRLPQPLWDKIERNGGVEWLRGLVKRAREAPKQR